MNLTVVPTGSGLEVSQRAGTEAAACFALCRGVI